MGVKGYEKELSLYMKIGLMKDERIQGLGGLCVLEGGWSWDVFIC